MGIEREFSAGISDLMKLMSADIIRESAGAERREKLPSWV
jgi:hypothetical protein